MRATPLRRRASVAGVLLAFISTGCSALIARTGQDIRRLKTRDEVCNSFGAPVARGDVEEGTFDEFRTRRKIAAPETAVLTALMGVATVGLSELFAFPQVAGGAVRAALVGQQVRFEYAADGTVREVWVDGEKHDRPGYP
jgi:hypothetical protein